MRTSRNPRWSALSGPADALRASFEKLAAVLGGHAAPVQMLAGVRDLSRRAVPDADGIRRSWLYLVTIGVPFVTATVLGHPHGAVLGGLVGLMCSFSDADESDLEARWLILLQVAFGMTAGGFVGFLLGGYSAPFWGVFALALFAAGWLTRLGRGPHLATRFAAIALGLTAGMPNIRPVEFGFVLLAVAAAAAARTIDHVRHGPLPAPAGFVPPSGFARHSEWLRFAAAYALVAMVGLWIGNALGMTRAIWITVAPLVIMVPDAQATHRRIAEFMFGTTVGVVIAWVLTHALTPVPLVLALLAIAPLVPLQFPRRFWLQTALIAVLLLIAFRLALPDPRSASALIVERLEDILVGCALALVGALLAFPPLERSRAKMRTATRIEARSEARIGARADEIG